jgi:hypothetical protein
VRSTPGFASLEEFDAIISTSTIIIITIIF